jgi:Ca2+-binding EF-hand superfamily protein
LKTFNFNLTQVEKLALMKKMDENNDNEISKEEFYNALASAGRDTIITRTIGGAVSPSRSN